jgi:hypothetical protein
MQLPPLKVREISIEQQFCKRIKEIGGKAYKFTSPNNRSVPDRIVIVKGLAPIFVEFKAPGKKLTAAQAREHKFLQERSQIVFVVDNFDTMETLLQFIIKYKGD